MKYKSWWVLAIATGVLAQTPAPTQFSGVINDYTPSTSTPMGPWECAAHGL